MEASFTAIARGITHNDLKAELTLIMAPEETSRLWKKVFVSHEKGLFINPDKPGRTYLEDHVEAQQKLRARHEKSKAGTPFEEKPFVTKPLTRETFKSMSGLTKPDFHLAARRLLEGRGEDGVPSVTLRTCKNIKVVTLKSWCNFRKWKNILLQELDKRDSNKVGLWKKDDEGNGFLDRDVWTKFKREHGVTKPKWVKLYQVATSEWLNRKRATNNKSLPVQPALDRLLRDWLQTDFNECTGQVITRWVSHNAIKKRLVIPKQDSSDVEWIEGSTIAAGFLDFRFIPGCVDEPIPPEVVESLVKYLCSPEWTPGVKSVPAWMIVSDLCSHDASLVFMSSLMRRHPNTFVIVPSFYFPCPAEEIADPKEIDGKRQTPALYIDHLIVPDKFPRWKVIACPMLAPDSRRYKVKPKDWSELTYEVNRGELRMEVYIKFLEYMGSAGGMVLNLFGGLKPVAAALASCTYLNYLNSFPFTSSLFHFSNLIDFPDARLQRLFLHGFGILAYSGRVDSTCSRT
jgi:hypothetical protein